MRMPGSIETTRRHAVELERNVAERTRELARAKERAEMADHLKSAFLATMSHELRTPLNSIIGFTGVILQGLAGPLNPEQTKQLEMVRGSARHLLALINDVLDISKIEAGQLNLGRERFDLRASIAKVSGIVAPLAEKKGLELHAHISDDLGQAVGDQRRMEQILLNLLNNAIKFTDRGKIELTAKLVPGGKTSGRRAAPLDIELSVSDTGMGIKTEDQTILFEPFRQIDSGLTRSHEGHGPGSVHLQETPGYDGRNHPCSKPVGPGQHLHHTSSATCRTVTMGRKPLFSPIAGLCC